MLIERSKPRLRCAIYTRVSSDSGLEQDFNSLDNQREAAEAYVKSQAHEGWILIRGRYDDGGYSGGTVERPALQKLLDDVRQGSVDVIVVYKVDRLTRSLADFAKLVELFDAKGASFVSVTQAFNTTTSMGRLTLNVLLSFAQFEREVTGERIRDKIAASKKKGLWMGGVVPLGYRVENRQLHVVEGHAELVRGVFRRYLQIGAVVPLKAALDHENVRLPLRVDGSGKTTGGRLISRGHLHKILTNPIYVGRLSHKGRIYDGQQSAIVDIETWDRVQDQLAKHVHQRKGRSQTTTAFLAGKLFDDRGWRMSPVEASKGARRWRYYVSQAILQGRPSEAGSAPRVPAPSIEAKVAEAIKLEEGRSQIGGGSTIGIDTNSDKTEGIADGTVQATCAGNIARIEKVIVSDKVLSIRLRDLDDGGADSRTISMPWTPEPTRRRREIIQGEPSPTIERRPMRIEARRAFAKAYAQSRSWLDKLTKDPGSSTRTIANEDGRSQRSIRQTLSLAFIDPRLVEAAIEGRLPRGFGLKRMMDLPSAWSEQWTGLGLNEPRLQNDRASGSGDRSKGERLNRKDDRPFV